MYLKKKKMTASGGSFSYILIAKIIQKLHCSQRRKISGFNSLTSVCLSTIGNVHSRFALRYTGSELEMHIYHCLHLDTITWHDCPLQDHLLTFSQVPVYTFLEKQPSWSPTTVHFSYLYRFGLAKSNKFSLSL